MDAGGSATHLTFLFTDIEASSRTWEAQPAVMSLALARHDELLHAAVKSAGGNLFKHTGDGVCAAFPTASSGMAAALAAQRSLQSEDWPSDAALRVRMALHSGAVQRRDADFFGPPLNRTARLLSTAHGGQVILSLVTAELVREELPDEADLLDLGEHRLADLTRPERVYQLTHPQLVGGFPPLRSLATRRHNLPVATSSFIGRESELAAVHDLVRASRLLTLIGIGGVGKTRLALQAAAGATESFPGGVFLIDLAPLTEPGLVPAQVCRTIGMVEYQGRRDPDELLDALCEFLRERSMLLLLDNCEHLVDAIARLADAVLARCPDVAILATSREPLAVGGEVLWRVPSLSVPPEDGAIGDRGAGGDAVTLFCERARAVDANFGLESENAAAVTRICRRLDGIPLAMELAAARVGVLSPDQIADRLDDSFRLLSGGPRTATARHQTLRATMDWSYELLSAAEQVLLQRLSVFAGSFDLPAVEGVAADGTDIAQEEVLDLLANLVAKSLVSAHGHGRETRYRLLETVRQYAVEKLARTGAEHAARRRHRDHYLDMAMSSSVVGDNFSEAHWLIRFDVLYDNLRAALDWSEANGDTEACVHLTNLLGAYWVLGGYLLEGRARLERALSLTAGTRDRARVRVLNALGFLIVQQGEFERSLALHVEALHLARELEGSAETGVSAFFVGARVLHQGQFESAAELLREASRRLREAGSPEGEAWCEVMLGWVATAEGLQSVAMDHFQAALRIAQPTSLNLRAHALGGAALIAAEAGDGDRAEAMADEGVAAARKLGMQTIVTMVLTRAVEVAILLGRWERAQSRLVELFTVLRDTGGRAFLADALEMAGVLQEARCTRQSARQLFDAAARVRKETGETPDRRPVTPLIEAAQQRLATAGPEPGPTGDVATFALRELDRGPVPAPQTPRDAVPAVLCRTARGWAVGYGRDRFELPDAKGLRYLARLLAAPDREIHVLDLAGGGEPVDASDAGPALDEQAKRAYRRRVRELEEEIEEARAWNDPGRLGRAEVELDALTHELAAAVGLGGRNRPNASNAERARVSVRKTIAAAVARIAEHNTDLGLLLGTTVKTGTYCRYTPDPRVPVSWQL